MTAAALHQGFMCRGMGLSTPVSIGTALSSAAIRGSFALTTTADAPAGSVIIVGVGAPGPASPSISVSSVSDGAAYTQLTTDPFESGTGLVGDLWYRVLTSTLVSGSTITATFSTNTSAQVSGIAAGYIQGVFPASPIDGKNHSFTNGGTSYASGSTGTLTQTAEMAIGMLYQFTASSNPSITEGSGFTNLNNQFQGSGAFYNIRLAYQRLSATTAVNYQPSSTVSGFAKCLVGTLKAYE